MQENDFVVLDEHILKSTSPAVVIHAAVADGIVEAKQGWAPIKITLNDLAKTFVAGQLVKQLDGWDAQNRDYKFNLLLKGKWLLIGCLISQSDFHDDETTTIEVAYDDVTTPNGEPCQTVP